MGTGISMHSYVKYHSQRKIVVLHRRFLQFYLNVNFDLMAPKHDRQFSTIKDHNYVTSVPSKMVL